MDQKWPRITMALPVKIGEFSKALFKTLRVKGIPCPLSIHTLQFHTDNENPKIYTRVFNCFKNVTIMTKQCDKYCNYICLNCTVPLN